MGGWVMLIFIAFLLFLTFISSHSLELAHRFDTEGRETTALVLDLYEEYSTDSDGDTDTTYYAVLQFDTNRGDRIELDRSVDWNLYEDTEIGESLQIWYLTTEPDIIEIYRGENRSTSVFTRWIALFFGALTLIAFWIPGRRAVAAVRARRYGVRETAVVKGRIPTSYTVNNRYRYRLTWQEQSGRTGQSLAYKESELKGFKAGQEITVYQGIKRAWWTGDVGERPKT
jgi:hypothetical protein